MLSSVFFRPQEPRYFSFLSSPLVIVSVIIIGSAFRYTAAALSGGKRGHYSQRISPGCCGRENDSGASVSEGLCRSSRAKDPIIKDHVFILHLTVEGHIDSRFPFVLR